MKQQFCKNEKLKIGIFGSHGTGKSTLAKEISSYFELPLVDKTMRQMWQDHGVEDFEKLPSQVRKIFQYKAILTQIHREDIHREGFVTDRTVLDNLAYTIDSSQISDLELDFYKALVRERIKNYTHLIYLPIQFSFEEERLRASKKSQKSVALIIENLISEFFSADLDKDLHKGKLLQVDGNLQERFTQVKNFINLSRSSI